MTIALLSERTERRRWREERTRAQAGTVARAARVRKADYLTWEHYGEIPPEKASRIERALRALEG